MVALGVEQNHLEEMLSRHFDKSVAICDWSLEKDDEAFGGLAGEKNLVRVENEAVGTLRILLKRVERQYAHEAEVYRTLQPLGAPVPTFYGHCDLPDGKRTMAVEYLPVTLEWPIPPDYHLAWVDAAARLASLPVSEEGVLRRRHWAVRLDQFIADVEDMLGVEEVALQEAYRREALLGLPGLCRRHLLAALVRADGLPQAFYHGDAYSPHTGRRHAAGEVLFFDLTTGAIGPRFMDLIAAVIDHGEPYEIEVEELEQHFLERYNYYARQDLSWVDFREEVSLCRALVALDRMRLTLDWFRGWLRSPDRATGPIGNDGRKWPLLHLRVLRQYLLL